MVSTPLRQVRPVPFSIPLRTVARSLRIMPVMGSLTLGVEQAVAGGRLPTLTARVLTVARLLGVTGRPAAVAQPPGTTQPAPGVPGPIPAMCVRRAVSAPGLGSHSGLGSSGAVVVCWAPPVVWGDPETLELPGTERAMDSDDGDSDDSSSSAAAAGSRPAAAAGPGGAGTDQDPAAVPGAPVLEYVVETAAQHSGARWREVHRVPGTVHHALVAISQSGVLRVRVSPRGRFGYGPASECEVDPEGTEYATPASLASERGNLEAQIAATETALAALPEDIRDAAAATAAAAAAARAAAARADSDAPPGKQLDAGAVAANRGSKSARRRGRAALAVLAEDAAEADPDSPNPMLRAAGLTQRLDALRKRLAWVDSHAADVAATIRSDQGRLFAGVHGAHIEPVVRLGAAAAAAQAAGTVTIRWSDLAAHEAVARTSGSAATRGAGNSDAPRGAGRGTAVKRGGGAGMGPTRLPARAFRVVESQPGAEDTVIAEATEATSVSLPESAIDRVLHISALCWLGASPPVDVKIPRARGR
jgi:hypothetical protein